MATRVLLEGFPRGDWCLHWIGGLHWGPPAGSNSKRTLCVEVYLRRVTLPEAQGEAVEPWEHPWEGEYRRRLEDVKLLPYLHLGSVWRDGSCVAYVESSVFSGFELDTSEGTETRVVRDCVGPLDYKVWTPALASKGTTIDETWFLSDLAWTHPLHTPCLLVQATDNEANATTVVIPVWEAFRTYFGLNSDLAQAFLRLPSRDVVADFIVKMSESAIAEDHCRLTMRPGAKRRMLRRLAAQILTQPEVRRDADQLYRATGGRMAPLDAELEGRFPTITLPFRGRASLAFRGMRIARQSRTPNYLALNIIGVDIPKPEGFRVGSYRTSSAETPPGEPESPVEGEEAPSLDVHVRWGTRAPSKRSISLLSDPQWLGDGDEVIERESPPPISAQPRPTEEPTTGTEIPKKVDLASGGGLSSTGRPEVVLKFRPGPEPGGDSRGSAGSRRRTAVKASSENFTRLLLALEKRGIPTHRVLVGSSDTPGASPFPVVYQGAECDWARGPGRMALIACLTHPRVASAWVYLLEALDAAKQHRMLMLWHPQMAPLTEDQLELVLFHCAEHGGAWFNPEKCALEPSWSSLARLRTRQFNHTSVAVDAAGNFDPDGAARNFAKKISMALPG